MKDVVKGRREYTERSRGSNVSIITYASLGFQSKCPFMYYYVTSGHTRKIPGQITASAKMKTLNAYKDEICDVEARIRRNTGESSVHARTILKNILAAQLELSFYDPDDYIQPLVDKNGVIERAEIKSNISAFRQKHKIMEVNYE